MTGIILFSKGYLLFPHKYYLFSRSHFVTVYSVVLIVTGKGKIVDCWSVFTPVSSKAGKSLDFYNMFIKTILLKQIAFRV
jgi:hypothetical protein